MCQICIEYNDFSIETIICEWFCDQAYSKLKQFTQLKVFDCHASNILYIPKELTSLERLVCYFSNLSELPNTLINLIELDCDYSQIAIIPDTLTNLIDLNCSSTHIRSIPNTLTNLVILHCEHTQISIIPSTLSNLVEIDCTATQISSIPNSLISLEYLSFGNGQQIDIPINICCILNDNDDSMMHMPIDAIIDIRLKARAHDKFCKLAQLYKYNKLSPILWQIAEYYTQRKYSPDNILKYIDLEN